MTKKEIYQERRQKLAELTAHFRKVREVRAEQARTEAEALQWLSRTLNSFIVEHYQQQAGDGEFNTFAQWKNQGRTIKKGEKGWPIWGQPLGSRPEDTDKGSDPEEDFKYFPLCYLFHESQTIGENEKAASSQRKEVSHA